MEHVAGLTAQPFFQLNRRQGMNCALASLTLIKNFLSLMKVLMAGPAISNSFYLSYDFMLNFEMTLITFNFMSCNVSRVHQVSLVIAVESVAFKMAFITVFPGDNSIAHNDLGMAALAGQIVLKGHLVIVSGFAGSKVF